MFQVSCPSTAIAAAAARIEREVEPSRLAGQQAPGAVAPGCGNDCAYCSTGAPTNSEPIDLRTNEFAPSHPTR